jgi:diguanylate cyclase (GGDEF)-like protein
MIRAAAPAVPLVVLTGRDDEELAVQAVREGAQDYLVKGQAEAALLSRALRHAMQRHRLQTTLQNLSVMDELTGLHNRRGFLNLAEQHLKLARRTRKPFSLAFIDLDGLKEVNDTLGHVEGDRALVETASLLRVCLRESDIPGRLGGDEFVLLLATATENSQDGVRRRLQEQLDSCNAEPGRRYKLSFSVGIVAVAPEQQLSIEELVSQADALMYQEKKGKQGRPRSVRVAERTEK